MTTSKLQPQLDSMTKATKALEKGARRASEVMAEFRRHPEGSADELAYGRAFGEGMRKWAVERRRNADS